MAAPRRIVYANVSATRGDKDESFEERRYLDYLKSYQTTGKPPPPCPPAPTDALQRAALGLPPLFEPLVEDEPLANGISPAPSLTPSVSISGASIGVSAGVGAGAAGRADMLAQAFVPTKVQEYGSETYFHSIVTQTEYAKWSFEELRCEAYKAGKKYADVLPTPPAPLQRPPLLPSAPLVTQTPPDSLQSVNSMPPYDQHSFEELRLACVRAGRPLTSPEIVAQNAILRLTV